MRVARPVSVPSTIHLRVRGRDRAYSVRVARGILARAGTLLRSTGARGSAALVTDHTVWRLHGARFAAHLRRAGFRVTVTKLPDGERAKAVPVYERLCEQWARDGVGRDTIVVALGGGVVSDVAGFAAATFSRGLDWVAFPTTLLAQVDAAVGGKVGINLDAGKNLIGAFHHPLAVFADPDVLDTLSARAYRAGLAEVVKMGVIARPGIIDDVARLLRRGSLRDASAMAPLIRAAVFEKARVVDRDERDLGARLALNFGHTVAHALEASTGYRRYLHGEAVAVGMTAALRLSVLEAGLDPVDAAAVEALLRALRLPTRIRRAPGKEFWSALARDKKRGRAGVRVVLCPAIGGAKVFEMSSLTTLRRVVLSLVKQP